MTKQIRSVYSEKPTKSTTSNDFTASINKDLTTNTVADAPILAGDPANFKKRDFAGRLSKKI